MLPDIPASARHIKLWRLVTVQQVLAEPTPDVCVWRKSWKLIATCCACHRLGTGKHSAGDWLNACRDLDAAMGAAQLADDAEEVEAAASAGDGGDAMDETEAAPVPSEQARTRCASSGVSSKP